MIVWIDSALAVALHDRQLAEHGGSSGVRDENLLGSALARPQQLYNDGHPQPDLADLSASLAFGLAKNHPFEDGNKRTATVCCETFIELNGATLNAEDAAFYVATLALADGKMPEAEFAAWLREHIMTIPRGVQEPRARYKTKARRRPPPKRVKR